jgi:hypothetical protein
MKKHLLDTGRYIIKMLIVSTGWMLSFTNLYAQSQGKPGVDSTTEGLSKELNNPVSALISVPFENNTEIGIGPNNGARNVLNIQPVIPFAISRNLNLITRVILPVVTQYDIFPKASHQNGIGDILLSEFISPSKVKNGLIWGAGPAFLIPSATNDFLGTKKWAMGPTAVLLKQINGWTIGALVNQLWSFSGSSNPAGVNQGYLQPFIIHTWKTGAGFAVSSEITHDWNEKITTAYIIPVITALTRIDKQTVQLNLGPRIEVASPKNRKSDFGIRASIVLVFPK